MDNMDKELSKINIKNVKVSDELIKETRYICRKSMENNNVKSRGVKGHKPAWRIGIAAISIAVMLVAVFMIPQLKTFGDVEAAAYYTVDINPSIGLQCDQDDKVLKIEYQNEDAKKLEPKLDCIGENIDEAVEQIIMVAEQEGYIVDDDAYVLVARFSNKGEVQLDQNRIENLLDGNLDKKVNILVVEGSPEYRNRAKNMGVSPGILLLSEITNSEEPLKQGTKVKDVVKGMDLDEINDSIKTRNQGATSTNIPSPTGDANMNRNYGESPSSTNGSQNQKHGSTDITGSMSGNTLTLRWSQINSDDFDGYKVMYSFSDSTPAYGESGCYSANTVVKKTQTKATLQVKELIGYEKGATCYFSITALYDGQKVMRNGNTISFKMQNSQQSQTGGQGAQSSASVSPASTCTPALTCTPASASGSSNSDTGKQSGGSGGR